MCLSHKEVRRKWIDILQNRSFINKLVFILENSLNGKRSSILNIFSSLSIVAEDDILGCLLFFTTCDNRGYQCCSSTFYFGPGVLPGEG